MLEYHLNAYDNILRCCNLMYNIVIRIKSMWSTLRHIRTYHNYICIDCPDNCSISKNKRIMKCHIVFWCYVLSFKIMYLTIQILINIRVNSTDFHVYFLQKRTKIRILIQTLYKWISIRFCTRMCLRYSLWYHKICVNLAKKINYRKHFGRDNIRYKYNG